MSEKKDIGNVLKSAMDGYSATPDDLWPALEADLKRQKRTRLLLWLLLLAGVIITLTIVFYPTNTDRSTSDDINTSLPIQKDNQKDPLKNKQNEKPVPSDSLSTETPKRNIDLEDNATQQKLVSIKTYRATNTKQNDQIDINTKNNSDGLKTDNVQRGQSPYRNLLSMLEAKQLGNLQLVIDSLEIIESESTVAQGKTERTWRFSPYVSVDHYNAFGRSTSKQNTFNYGAFLYFYASDYTALRIGVKKVDFQYNFLDRNDASQQQVSYLEVPLEVRSFFNKGKKFKTSFIAGGSFLMVQNATLIDFENNSMLENKDLFTTSSFSLNAGLGLHYDLNSKWRLNFESLFKYHVEPFSRNQTYNPYNLSLSFGIEYGF